MEPSETLWQELATAALLGTERHAVNLPSLSGRLGALLAQLNPADSARYLLESAALTVPYRQAGKLLETVHIPSPEPAEVDDWERCSPAASVRLGIILSGQYADLLPEWLMLAEKAKKRVPEELLSPLLDWGEKHPQKIALLLPVIAQRGAWLAKQNPAWQVCAAVVQLKKQSMEEITAAWQLGARAVRRIVLTHLRLLDTNAARELLLTTWKEEAAEDRVFFIQTLSSGLSMADEPFLESVLDDRSSTVRAAAAGLLSLLPQSRLVQRQLDRLQPIFNWGRGGLLRQPLFDVTLPEICTPEMIRDGMDPKPAHKQKSGEKSLWFQYMLEAVPPAVWCDKWKQSAEKLVKAASWGDWSEMLLESLERSAIKHHDADWIEAIFNVYPDKTHLLDELPDNRREAIFLPLLKTDPMKGIDLLARYKHPWSLELTRIALDIILKYNPPDKDYGRQYGMKSTFTAFGYQMQPAAAPDAVRKLTIKTEEFSAAWQTAVEKMLTLLDFRRQMMEELHS